MRDLANGFDQETAAIIIARYAVHMTQEQEYMDIVRWLDRMLIKLTAKFGEFKKDDPLTFRMSRNLSLFP